MSPGILAFDIGGANLKACDATNRAEVQAFALYRNPERLAEELRSLAARMAPPRLVVATMTAELCDCFQTKRQGVLHVISALESIYQPGILRIWGVDGAFHTISQIRAEPSLAEASNWKALGDCLAREFFARQGGLVIDIGSTTTDILAVSHGRLLSDSRTDLDRLQSGELVYLGVSRTPLCAMISDVKFRKTTTPVMRELFATSGDVYWTLGDLEEDADDLSTANGQPATRSEARHRLARMIGLDFEHFSEQDATEMATQADTKILKTLEKAARKVAERLPEGKIEHIVVSGSGSFLAQRLAEKITGADQITNLQNTWGDEAANAACASALVRLARELIQS